MTNQQIGR